MQPVNPVMQEDMAAPSIPNISTKKKHKIILSPVILTDNTEENLLSLVAEIHIFKTTNKPIENCENIKIVVAVAAYIYSGL